MLKCMELTDPDLRDSYCVSVVLIKTFSVLLLQACLLYSQFRLLSEATEAGATRTA